MKILGISGSPRPKGNTAILLEEALAGARETGAETELISAYRMNIKPCDGCDVCNKEGVCHINDDMQLVYKKMLEANGIIFGSPVYMWSMTGQLKILVERTIALRYPRPRLGGKAGGIIVVAARTGLATVCDNFYRYFQAHHMFSCDWVNGCASTKGAIRKDISAMKGAWELGRQVVLVAEKGPQALLDYDQPLYKWVQDKYGVPSSLTELK